MRARRPFGSGGTFERHNCVRRTRRNAPHTACSPQLRPSVARAGAPTDPFPAPPLLPHTPRATVSCRALPCPGSWIGLQQHQLPAAAAAAAATAAAAAAAVVAAAAVAAAAHVRLLTNSSPVVALLVPKTGRILVCPFDAGGRGVIGARLARPDYARDNGCLGPPAVAFQTKHLPHCLLLALMPCWDHCLFSSLLSGIRVRSTCGIRSAAARHAWLHSTSTKPCGHRRRLLLASADSASAGATPAGRLSLRAQDTSCGLCLRFVPGRLRCSCWLRRAAGLWVASQGYVADGAWI